MKEFDHSVGKKGDDSSGSLDVEGALSLARSSAHFLGRLIVAVGRSFPLPCVSRGLEEQPSVNAEILFRGSRHK